MRFEVWQEGTNINPLMIINADSPPEAWKKLKKIGIKNRSKLFSLVETE